jgi:hypothetical protein
MTYHQKYINCVFSQGTHMTNYYYYNKILIAKNALILKLKFTVNGKNTISDTLK